MSCGKDVEINLDSVLCGYTGKCRIVMKIQRRRQRVEIQDLLSRLRIPKGMVGCIVAGNRLLEPNDTVTPPCTLKMFGIYDGG